MRVRLLGGFGVEVGGEDVDPARWRLRKARTVVKLLCLERGQKLHREFLLHLLWPSLAPAAASNNLHQALHTARRALAAEGTDGLLELRDQLVVLRADGLVEVDAERFRALAVAALDGGDLAALRAADAAYLGELLPEDRFEAWATGPRDELHALHRDVLVGLGRRLRAEGLLAEAEAALDGGIVLDLSPMKGIRVDPRSRRVTAEAGCLWSDVDHETQAFGLALTGGLVSTTGIAGFTLGGGLGWLVRRCGLTSDNLVGADVVTADGQLVHASADEHPDLFWALRGGGGNFGVVTSFEYALHEVGPTVFAGVAFYPGGAVDDILRGYRQACAGARDELTTLLNLAIAPPAPFLPEEVHGTPIVAVAGMWSGPIDEGDAATRPFRGLADPIADLYGPMPYVAMQSLLDALYPRGMHNYFRSAFVPALDDGVLGALADSYRALPNPLTELHVHHLGGALGRIPSDATAFATRDLDFIVNAIARTPSAEGFDAARDWARDATDALGSGAATYVNFTGEAAADRVQASYPPATYQKLVRIKDRYDPDNVFRLNQNIPPTG